MEAVEGGCYRRTIEIAGVIGAIEVSDEPHESRLAMRVNLPSYDGLMEVVQLATRLFDLGADALHIGRHLSRDGTIASMVAERPGLRVPGVWDGFSSPCGLCSASGLRLSTPRRSWSAWCKRSGTRRRACAWTFAFVSKGGDSR